MIREFLMKKSLIVSAICVSMAFASCNKAVSQTKNENAQKAQNSGEKTAILSSLSKEQQEAVKLLIRDTLVSNPEILLEAQEAYEAKMAREQNESVSKQFDKIVSEANELSFGPTNAKITFVEFFDYRCGYCHAANPFVMKTISENKDIRYIFKELPILSPNSLIAAKAAIASKSQGKYLAFHQALMVAKGDLNLDQIMGIAQSVGLDTAKLKTEMESPKVLQHIEKVKEQAQAVGISGTPGFIINGKLVSGFNQQEIEAAIGAARQ